MPRKPSYDREDLITRAKDLFWKRGWAGTSLKDLEGELNMKPGSFYAAFGSKDALFALALDKYSGDGVARITALAQEHGPLRALQKFPALMIENDEAPAKACMLCKTLLELQTHAHPLAEKANQHLQKMEALFASLFAQARTANEITTDTDPQLLACKYQSDLLGLRVTAERGDVNASAIAAQMSESLAML